MSRGTKIRISRWNLRSAVTELQVLLREVEEADIRLNVVTDDQVTAALKQTPKRTKPKGKQ